MYILSVFLFEVGSAVCGAAPTMDALIIGRAIAGWGGAGMYIGVLTLLSVTTSTHERPAYLGLTGLTWGAGEPKPDDAPFPNDTDCCLVA